VGGLDGKEKKTFKQMPKKAAIEREDWLIHTSFENSRVDIREYGWSAHGEDIFRWVSVGAG